MSDFEKINIKLFFLLPERYLWLDKPLLKVSKKINDAFEDSDWFGRRKLQSIAIHLSAIHNTELGESNCPKVGRGLIGTDSKNVIIQHAISANLLLNWQDSHQEAYSYLLQSCIVCLEYFAKKKKLKSSCIETLR